MTDKDNKPEVGSEADIYLWGLEQTQAEVERLTALVDDPINIPAVSKLAARCVEAEADRDRLRGAIKVLDADLVRLIDEHTPAITPVDHGLCSALAYVRPKLAALAEGEGEGEGGV